MEVISTIKNHPNVANYLDIPLQHGSSKVLKDMRRGITREKTTELIKNIREVSPEIAIRTTLIVGYPGETEADFQEMKEWVEEMKFERLGVFTYSHEENTHAYNAEDDVPEDIKHSRAEEIMALQSQISYDKNQALVGKTMKVLIDKVEGGEFIGRTEYDSPEVDNEVRIPAKNEYLRVGDYSQIKIISADFYDLYGEIVN